MSYAIMRIAKLKGNNDFARVFNHNHRDYENTPGVDKDKEHLNIYGGPISTYKEAKYFLDERTKEIQNNMSRKMRKDTVKGMEILFASDKEFFTNDSNVNEYFKRAIEWLNEMFGEERVMSYNLHLDEVGSPHIHAVVTCIEYNEKNQAIKYNVKNWVNGRDSLVALQDSWFEKVKGMGLERGKSIKETHNYHKSKQEYVKLLEKDLQSVRNLGERETEERIFFQDR